MTDLSELKDWAILVVGNIFIVLLLIRTVGAWAKREYGDLFTNLAIAIVIGFLVYANDSAIALIQQLGRTAFGA